ncbi:MAG: C-terminal binding protein [Solirubrobacteraceae bacterium]
MSPLVAIIGARYADFSIEQDGLAALGAELCSGDGASAEEIVRIAGDADVILAGGAPRFDASVIERLRARGIVRYGVGVDTIDLDAARLHGLWVAHVTDYGTEAVALHAVTLALAGIRRLHEADARVREGQWSFGDLRPLHLPSALTAGVVGFGRIGQRAAQMLVGLGFRVLAHDLAVPVDGVAGVRAASLDEVLSLCDVISLHAPGVSGTPLLDRDALARLRPGSVLVNTARASLIDVVALADGLRAGRPRIAALDVFPQEPPDLSKFDGVRERLLLTPHMAWYTEESERIQRQRAVEAVRRLLSGERPDDVVVEPDAR